MCLYACVTVIERENEMMRAGREEGDAYATIVSMSLLLIGP